MSHPLDNKIRWFLCAVLAVIALPTLGFWTFYAMALVLFGLMIPTFGPPACSDCNSGTSPTQIQLDITGWANGICSQCTSLNGSFILSQVNPCFFKATIGPYCGSLYADYEVQFSNTPGNPQILITTCGGNDQFNIGTAPSPQTTFDCSASHSSVTIRTNGCSLNCDGSGASITYTPLAPFN